MREKFAFQKSIGLALKLEGKLPFLLCFTWYLMETSKYKPLEGVGGGGLYLEGLFNGEFFAL